MSEAEKSISEQAAVWMPPQAVVATFKLRKALEDAVQEVYEAEVPLEMILGCVEGEKMRVDLAITNAWMANLKPSKR